jgi:O-antigen/teichoic acid export membrane protein
MNDCVDAFPTERTNLKRLRAGTSTMGLKNIIDIVTSRLAKRISFVFAGNMSAALLGFIAVLMISRNLAVGDFGLFNLAVSIMLIAARLSGLGMEVGMTRFASSYLAEGNIADARQVIRLTLSVKAVMGVVIGSVIFVSSGYISTEVFRFEGLASLLKISAFGVIAVSLSQFMKYVFTTYLMFKRAVVLQFLIDIGKISSVILIVYLFSIDAFSSVAVFAAAPLLGALYGLVKLRGELFSAWKPFGGLFTRLFSYSRWLFFSSICGILLHNVGLFLLARMSGSEAVGIYGLALNIIYIFPIIIHSLDSVLLPEVSRFKEVRQLEGYIKGSLRISLYIGLMLVPVLFFSEHFIVFFLGARYVEAVPVFNWLLLSSILLTVNSTLLVAVFAMNKPHVAAALALAKLLLITAGCLLFIPSLGVIAPAITTFFVNVGALCFLSVYAVRKIRGGKIDLGDVDMLDGYGD